MLVKCWGEDLVPELNRGCDDCADDVCCAQACWVRPCGRAGRLPAGWAGAASQYAAACWLCGKELTS
jgi:hypothetical protein